MKINRLEIHNVRGIRHLTLNPNGKSIVVYGPNGSGKSAIVDAIDFLLTGSIARLRGPGTRGITPSRYGPHIDTDTPEDSWVAATIALPSGEVANIRRDFDNPRVYACAEEHRGELDALMAVSTHGQHILSRRELLRFITAERGTRGRAIQTLLKMDDIEDVRETLVGIANEADEEYTNAERQLGLDQRRVADAASVGAYDTTVILNSVNAWRRFLGAEDTAELASQAIRRGITPPQGEIQAVVNKTVFREKLTGLQDLLGDEHFQSVENEWSVLASSAKELRGNPGLLRDYRSIDLVERGISILGESALCPLCCHEWPTGELKRFLDSRLSAARKARTLYETAMRSAGLLREAGALLTSKLRAVGLSYRQVGLDSESDLIERRVQEIEEDLKHYDIESMLQIGSPYKIGLFDIASAVRQSGVINSGLHWIESAKDEPSPIRTAWDRLVEIETQLRNLEDAQRNLKEKEAAKQRATVLSSSFVQARDSVVESLFRSIGDRFAALYSRIHSEDEPAFSATLELEGPECEFLVDFYGRNLHPPHALHSEGHQDSMGLCMYLAIAEYLGRNQIELIVLDDVVMSIDSDHRRGVCDILRAEFPSHQFLITTHDKTWAYQLKAGLSIDRSCFIQFSNWTLEQGPVVEEETDIWEHIHDLIDSRNVPTAAHTLRRWLEQFFDKVCASIEAKTTHSQDGKHELWDMLSGAIGSYKELLKEGIKAARSLESGEESERLEELESVRVQILQRINSEYWTVNAAVHYNEWATFSPSDFKPVVEAFEDFCAQFICQSCGSLIRVLKSGVDRVAFRCNCGVTGWSLVV